MNVIKNRIPVILSVYALLMIPLLLRAAPIEPVRTMEIPYYSPFSTPILDGIADDDGNYSELQTTNYGYETQLPNWDGDSDFRLDFQVCWSETALYILVNCLDDVAHNYQWDYQSEWMFDNFEIFLQLDTNTVIHSYGPNTIQLRINRGLDSVQNPGRAKRSDYGYFMNAETGGGWVAEVAVPWTAVYSLGDTPEDIMDYFEVAIGFDVHGADSDNADGDETVGNRDFQTFWDLDGQDGTEDQAWNNTKVFGYAYLVCNWDGCWPNPYSVEASSEDAVACFPNPAGNYIVFPDLEEVTSVRIYNMQGINVLDLKYQPGQELNISTIPEGIYQVVLNDNRVVRFIKQ